MATCSRLPVISKGATFYCYTYLGQGDRGDTEFMSYKSWQDKQRVQPKPNGIGRIEFTKHVFLVRQTLRVASISWMQSKLLNDCHEPQ